MVKIFLDTSNIEDIKKYDALIDGVTTNPTLARKAGFSDMHEVAEEVSKLIYPRHVSVEVISTKTEGMVKEAKKLAEINDNIVIKIPLTMDGLKATKELAKQGVKVNNTLVFSANQALLAAKVGARYASIFVGRLDDISFNSLSVIESCSKIWKNYNFKTPYGERCELLIASIRHPLHVIKCLECGVDVVTIPPSVLDLMIKHPKTDEGLERFLRDWGVLK